MFFTLPETTGDMIDDNSRYKQEPQKFVLWIVLGSLTTLWQYTKWKVLTKFKQIRWLEVPECLDDEHKSLEGLDKGDKALKMSRDLTRDTNLPRVLTMMINGDHGAPERLDGHVQSRPKPKPLPAGRCRWWQRSSWGLDDKKRGKAPCTQRWSFPAEFDNVL